MSAPRRYVVTTRDRDRAALWLSVWGTSVLPVLSPDPRGTPACYLVDGSKFDAHAIERAIGYVTGAFKISRDEAARELERYGGFPVKAEGCDLLEDDRN